MIHMFCKPELRLIHNPCETEGVEDHHHRVRVVEQGPSQGESVLTSHILFFTKNMFKLQSCSPAGRWYNMLCRCPAGAIAPKVSKCQDRISPKHL